VTYPRAVGDQTLKRREKRNPREGGTSSSDQAFNGGPPEGLGGPACASFLRGGKKLPKSRARAFKVRSIHNKKGRRVEKITRRRNRRIHLLGKKKPYKTGGNLITYPGNPWTQSRKGDKMKGCTERLKDILLSEGRGNVSN